MSLQFLLATTLVDFPTVPRFALHLQITTHGTTKQSRARPRVRSTIHFLPSFLPVCLVTLQPAPFTRDNV